MLRMSKDKLTQAFRKSGNTISEKKPKQTNTIKNWGWFKTFAQYCSFYPW